MKIFYIIIIIFLNVSNLYSESYELEWTGDFEFTKSIKYQDESIRNRVCPDQRVISNIEFSDLYQYREKGIKKKGSSNKKNVGNINCDSPVWKKKPICN